MEEKNYIRCITIVIIILLVAILVFGILFALSKRNKNNDGSNTDVWTKQDLTKYNIAYGNEAPTDKTKLWVKCDKPKKIEVSDTINKTITNESIETLDWELDIGNNAYAGAVVGTDLFIFTKGKGVIKVDLLTGEDSQVSKTNLEYQSNAITAVPYGQYIYIAYMHYFYRNGWYDLTLYVKKFNTVNNEFIGSWAEDKGTSSGSSGACCYGFIYNEQFFLSLELYNYVFDLATCKFLSTSDTIFKGFPYSNAQYELLNGKCYSFQANKIVKSDLKNNFEKEVATSSISSNYYFTPKGVGINIYLFGQSGGLGGNGIQRYNTVSNALDTLDILMCTKRDNPIVARLGASFYIIGGSASNNGYNVCEKFTTEFELEEGTLILLTNGKKGNEIALWKDEEGIDYMTSISNAYIGNSKGKGESVEVYMYDEEQSDWRLIAA